MHHHFPGVTDGIASRRATDVSPRRAPLCSPRHNVTASPARSGPSRQQTQLPLYRVESPTRVPGSPRRTASPRRQNTEKSKPVYVGVPMPAGANIPPMAQPYVQPDGYDKPHVPAPVQQNTTICPFDPVVPVMGKQVDYWSNSNGCWVPATITGVNAESGLVTLDCKRGTWTHNTPSQVRARTRPSQAQLENMRNILHEGNLQEEAGRLFNAYASNVGGGGFDIGLVERSAIALGQEVDKLLGVVGAAVWLKTHIAGAPRGVLTLDTFTSIMCKHLWIVYKEYGQAVNPESSAPQRFGNPTDVFVFQKKLGEGTYGAVYLATRKDNPDTHRAVKMLRKHSSRVDNTELEQEISHLCTLDHPHIIKLYEYFEHADHVYLVMDFCAGGDLQEFANRAKSKKQLIDEEFVRNSFKQILKAIAHVHAHGSMHLDLKPGNVMLTPIRGTLPPAGGDSTEPKPGMRKVHAMLIDMGLARIFRPGNRDVPCGTPTTMAPEVWRGELTPKADIFSLGCMLFEVFCNELPFPDVPGTVPEGQRYWGYTQEVHPPEVPFHKLDKCSGQGKNLCQDLMVYQRQYRPTASECLQAPFFCRGFVDPLYHDKLAMTATIEDVSPMIIQRLTSARSRTFLQRSVAITIARRWPANQLPSIKRAFEALDSDGTGRLQKDNVMASFMMAGVESVVARQIAEAMDLNRTGMIDWTEFVACCIDLGDISLQKDLRQLFNYADKDGDGLLSAHDVGSLLTAELCNSDAVNDAIDGIIDGSDPSGRISWKDFLAYFQNCQSKEKRQPPRAPSPSPRPIRHDQVLGGDQLQQLMGQAWQFAFGGTQAEARRDYSEQHAAYCAKRSQANCGYDL